MFDTLFGLGYLGLFLISFLGATLVPRATEVFVIGMARLDYNIWWVMITATMGGFVGNLVNYYVGQKGTDFVLSRYIKIDEKTWARAETTFQKYGVVALFFSWLPIVGDPLTIVAGAFHTKMTVFTFWVILGKFLRYIVLLGLANRILDALV